jgi:hypothetical protein
MKNYRFGGMVLALVLGAAGAANARPGFLEFLLRVSTGRDVVALVEPQDTSIQTEINFPQLLSAAVPASRSFRAIFIEVTGSVGYQLTADAERDINTAVTVALVSDTLPPNFAVSAVVGLARDSHTNHAGDRDLGPRRTRRTLALILRRDQVDTWNVIDTTTGQPVPEQQALGVLSELIDRGFRVDLGMIGHMKGASTHFAFLDLEVRRALR